MPGVDGQDTGREETSESTCQRCADDVESETESQFGVAIEAGQVERDTREYTSFSDTENCRRSRYLVCSTLTNQTKESL